MADFHPPADLDSAGVDPGAGRQREHRDQHLYRRAQRRGNQRDPLGRRRYTSVVGISDLAQHMVAVPQDQLTAATTREVGEANVPLNVRTWNSPEGVREVVAIGRAGDDLAVIEVDKLTPAQVMPL